MRTHTYTHTHRPFVFMYCTHAHILWNRFECARSRVNPAKHLIGGVGGGGGGCDADGEMVSATCVCVSAPQHVCVFRSNNHTEPAATAE